MNTYDCIVVGGGVGGLTAGIYLARFLCNTCVIDNDDSRASLIPTSHNFPAFPEGIPGADILKRLRLQYQNYKQSFIKDTVLSIKKNKKFFTVKLHNNNELAAKNIILATGVIDIEPLLPNITDAVKKGLIRHCLICDAYEVQNKKIAILGNSKKGLREAFLLSKYSADVTLINLKKIGPLTTNEKLWIKTSNIKLINRPITDIKLHHDSISIIKMDNDVIEADTVYSALGVVPRTVFGIKMGARVNKEKLLIVNAHQQTNIPGLYAIGDIVPGLNQMCVATSHGAIAALDIFKKIEYGK